MRSLHAFFNDPDGSRLVGTFHEAQTGEVTFTYVDDVDATPVSLSLPRDRPHAPQAAATYLDNLLPDDDSIRARWATERGAAGTDVFSLLSVVGEDVAGAISLSPDPELADREAEPLVEATTDDIAGNIAAIRADPTRWLDPRPRPKLSLAGTQGKFSLAKVGDRWFWPTYEVPSTHIIKPGRTDLPHIDEYEAGSLLLAKSLGVPAANAEVFEAKGQRAFIVERWDRFGGVRLHAEDLAQALGVPVAKKYGVSAASVARLLVAHEADPWPFVRQLAFNTYLGNGDAHGKNYSLLLNEDEVALAPLYDSVPTFLYPRYDQTLAMRVGTAHEVRHATAAAWKRFADDAGLDPGIVQREALTIGAGIAARLDEFIEPPEKDSARRRLVYKHTRTVSRITPTQPSPPPTAPPAGTTSSSAATKTSTWSRLVAFFTRSAGSPERSAARGRVWVPPHHRAGRRVKGHWRRR